MPARLIVPLAFEGAGLLDVAGPAEVFAVADALAGGGAYRVAVASPDGGDRMSAAGFRIGVAAAVGDLPGPPDTLLVPGSWTWPRAAADPAVMDVLGALAARSARLFGVCAGALLLAEAGLLDGRRATTHWRFLDELATRFPAVRVERDAIFVCDAGVVTSAGVTAGIDAALALVEADHGAALAREVARHLVMFMQRPGGQAQFSVRLQADPPERASLRGLLDAVAADPAGDHRLPELAARAGFSERHLTRVFIREVGVTPARYVEAVRVEAARGLLERSDAPLATVARQAGLGSAESLRRAFARTMGTTPDRYRRRFRTTGVLAGAGAPRARAEAPVPPVALTQAGPQPSSR